MATTTTIWELRELPENQRCADCTDRFPRYVCLDYNTFVCSSCANVHKEMGHRVESAAMYDFSQDELASLSVGGNKAAIENYMATWSPAEFPEPSPKDQPKVREFIKSKYSDLKWARSEAKLPVAPSMPPPVTHATTHKLDAKDPSFKYMLSRESSKMEPHHAAFSIPPMPNLPPPPPPITSSSLPPPPPPITADTPFGTVNLPPIGSIPATPPPISASAPAPIPAQSKSTITTTTTISSSKPITPRAPFVAELPTPASDQPHIPAHTYVSNQLSAPAPPKQKVSGIFTHMLAQAQQQPRSQPATGTIPSSFVQQPQLQSLPQQPQQQHITSFNTHSTANPFNDPAPFSSMALPASAYSSPAALPVPSTPAPMPVPAAPAASGQVTVYDPNQAAEYQRQYDQQLQELRIQHAQYQEYAKKLAQYHEAKQSEDRAKDMQYSQVLQSVATNPVAPPTDVSRDFNMAGGYQPAPPPVQQQYQQQQQQPSTMVPYSAPPQQQFQQPQQQYPQQQYYHHQQQQQHAPTVLPQGMFATGNVLDFDEDQTVALARIQRDKDQMLRDQELARQLQAEEDARAGIRRDTSSVDSRTSSRGTRGTRARNLSEPIAPRGSPAAITTTTTISSSMVPYQQQVPMAKCVACQMEMQKSVLGHHNLHECIFRPMFCPYCEKSVKFVQYQDHLAVCPTTKQPCSACGQIFFGGEIPNHLRVVHGIVRQHQMM